MNTYEYVINYTLINQIQQYIKGVIHYDQIRLSQECKVGSTIRNVRLVQQSEIYKEVGTLQHFERTKKIPTIISTDAEFDKIQQSFMIRRLSKLGRGLPQPDGDF